MIIRVAGDPAACVDVVRRIVGPAAEVAVERDTLVVHVAHPEQQTPALVAALVDARAQVLEVRAEMPALEDVYLHLMNTA